MDPWCIRPPRLSRTRQDARPGIQTAYQFEPGAGRIDVRSTITNTGQVPFEDLSYSLYFDVYHRYYFNPYDEQKFPGLNFRVYQSRVITWHLSTGIGSRTRKRSSRAGSPGRNIRGPLHPPGRFDRRQDPADDLPDSGGSRDGATVAFNGMTATGWSSSSGKPELIDLFPDRPGKNRFIRKSFFPRFLSAPGQLSFPPWSRSWWRSAGRTERLHPRMPAHRRGQGPSQGRPREAVPGKVSFLGIDPTESPYFEPDNPIETGRDWEGFKNSCFPGEDGLIVRLPVGTYLAAASRGPEFRLTAGSSKCWRATTPDLVMVIDRVVETPGLISFDPHMHTNRSDGDPSVSERIKSVVAEASRS